jgi:hypothetical protein
MITDQRGRRRRFIYEPRGELVTPAEIPTTIERAHHDLDADLKPGQCAVRRGKIVVRDVEILGQSPRDFDPRDFTQRTFPHITVTVADAFRAGMIAAAKLRRAQ